MNKLYTRINWVNNTTPALNETNLNLMSKGIDDIDNRVVNIAGDIMTSIGQIEQDLQQAEALLAASQTLKEDSESWANGQRDGVDVPSTDPAYQNNSKYYKEQAQQSANSASSSASDAADVAEDAMETLAEVRELLPTSTFTINFTTGELEYTNSARYNFTINTTTGNLEWEVTT